MSALGALAHFALHWPLTGPFALGFFLTPLLCVYFVFVFVGPWTWGLPILTRGPKRGNAAVALTFDDGPSAQTPRILDALRAANVRATFFVLGAAAERSPEIVRRIAAEGHRIGLHGFTHTPFVLLSRAEVEREIARAEAAVHRACPDAEISRWVRPPHGFKSLSLVWTLRRAGYGFAAWSVSSRDYAEHDPARIAARVLDRVQAGAVILLHDGPANAATANALPDILAGLKERGWIAAPLPDFLSTHFR